MATKLARIVIYLGQLLIIKSFKVLIMWSCKVTWQTKTIISLLRVFMATKLGRMIASLDGLLPIMSHDPLITCPCEIWWSLTGGGSACKCLSRHQLRVEFVRIVCLKTLSFHSLLFWKENVILTEAYLEPS